MSYWEDRLIQTQETLTSKTIAQTEKQLKKYYARAAKSVISDFEATLDKLYATVGEGRAPTPADLYKLDRYWQMQAQLRKQLEALGEYQYTLFFKKFTEHYAEIYEAIALKTHLSYGTISRETAEQMINQIWCADGKSWSSRIWTNTAKLQEALNENLIDCVLTGKRTTQLKQLLQSEFNTSYTNADSLVRTEMAHIQTQAAQQRYKDAGVTEVKVWADKDERRCEVCGELHEKRFPINGSMPIPAHPRCRCCIIPVVE